MNTIAPLPPEGSKECKNPPGTRKRPGWERIHLTLLAMVTCTTVMPTAGLAMTQGGGPGILMMGMALLPTGNALIGLSGSNTIQGRESPDSFTFSIPKSTTLRTASIIEMADGRYSAVATNAGSIYFIVDAADINVANTAKGGKKREKDDNDDDDNDDDDGDNDNDDDNNNDDGDKGDGVGAGISVTPPAGLTTTEAGSTAKFMVALSTLPTANVTVGLSSSDPTEGTVSPASLTFTSASGTCRRR